MYKVKSATIMILLNYFYSILMKWMLAKHFPPPPPQTPYRFFSCCWEAWLLNFLCLLCNLLMLQVSASLVLSSLFPLPLQNMQEVILVLQRISQKK